MQNLEGVQLYRLIIRLLKSLYYNNQNCTAIVQLKVAI